ncbi:hypothetical protein [Polycladidibacter hongkongensis]|nr:hypothetical protein [Pseudovibrio hongkongensis]
MSDGKPEKIETASKKSPAVDKQERLAQALRDNLKKRKAAARSSK